MLWQLPSGDDIGATSVHLEADGTTMVLYDHFACREAAESDAWKIGEDLTPHLTVKVEGDAKGTVTSSPAGIDCGTDCNETYEFGTGVTLTAHPSSGATFAGWSGACTGSSSTCTLEMNRARVVTATFTNKPVLTVTKGGTGTGTVTSNPAGINCGMDCFEPYNEGTSVTLTADPAADSSLVWSGACTGSAPTCVVTMNVSKEAIATFTLKPLLTVSKTGDGSGTVSGPGINCGLDCEEHYSTDMTVTLTAEPSPGSVFTWTGCDAVELVFSCRVAMSGNRTVTVDFDDPALPAASSRLSPSAILLTEKLL